jgi:dihydrofolate reductase
MGKRKIILYIATSLDGYIARENGDIDWLFSDQDYGYTDFLKSVDTLILGNRTYKQALTFGEFPYKDKICYVFSKTIKGKNEYVTFINGDFLNFIEKLRNEEGKDIWLVGGTRTIDIFTKNNLIDEFIISIHPIILGKGIELFKQNNIESKLVLKDSVNFSSGLVQLHYELIR